MIFVPFFVSFVLKFSSLCPLRFTFFLNIYPAFRTTAFSSPAFFCCTCPLIAFHSG